MIVFLSHEGASKDQWASKLPFECATTTKSSLFEFQLLMVHVVCEQAPNLVA